MFSEKVLRTQDPFWRKKWTYHQQYFIFYFWKLLLLITISFLDNPVSIIKNPSFVAEHYPLLTWKKIIVFRKDFGDPGSLLAQIMVIHSNGWRWRVFDETVLYHYSKYSYVTTAFIFMISINWTLKHWKHWVHL